MKSLIVYSDVVLLSMFKRWATHSSEHLMFAKNAQKAIEMVNEESINFVITELNLTDTDGLELVAQLSVIRPSIKIAFFLPADFYIDSEKLCLLNSLYFIHQPISLKEFIHFVGIEVLGVAEFQTLPISQIRLIDFLKLISYQHKTCLLEIENSLASQIFQLYFESGILYNAVDVSPKAKNMFIQSAYLSTDFSSICKEFEASSIIKQLLTWQHVKLRFNSIKDQANCCKSAIDLHRLIK